MAKIETTFIRPKELYTPETGETKVVYDGYQNNPHELVVEENLEGEVSKIVNDTFVPNDGGNVVFTDGSDVEHELITKSGLGKAQVIETTWQALKDLRDNSQLIAGSLYRITDYNCTTTQENTQSAGHQFDIVLLALSEDKLAEEGWAMMHDNDGYDVTFTDGVIKKCYITSISDENVDIVDIETLLGVHDANIVDEIHIDEVTKTASMTETGYSSLDLVTPNLTYNYFQNSNLSAWKVWYCLDNDKSRFAWADDSVDESTPAFITTIDGKGNTHTLYRDSADDLNNLFAWNGEGMLFPSYSASQTPSAGDTLYSRNGGVLGTVNSFTPAHEGTGEANGRGVIYRLIDEFNNDVPWDFKNIMFTLNNETTYSLSAADQEHDATLGGNTLGVIVQTTHGKSKEGRTPKSIYPISRVLLQQCIIYCDEDVPLDSYLFTNDGHANIIYGLEIYDPNA